MSEMYAIKKTTEFTLSPETKRVKTDICGIFTEKNRAEIAKKKLESPKMPGYKYEVISFLEGCVYPLELGFGKEEFFDRA